MAMVIEEDPSVCRAVEEGQGVPALVNMLITGGNQGKKVANLSPLKQSCCCLEGGCCL